MAQTENNFYWVSRKILEAGVTMGPSSEPEMANTNPPYYRLFVDSDDNSYVVEMQPIDESGYDQSRFINTRHYPTEGLATSDLWDLKRLAGNPLLVLDRFKMAAKELGKE